MAATVRRGGTEGPAAVADSRSAVLAGTVVMEGPALSGVVMVVMEAIQDLRLVVGGETAATEETVLASIQRGMGGRGVRVVGPQPSGEEGGETVGMGPSVTEEAEMVVMSGA